MNETIKFTLCILAAGILAVIVCGYIFDYFDKRKLERRNTSLLKRSEARQAMNCENCNMVLYYKNAINELTQEKEYMEQTIHNLNIQNSILQSSLTKAKLHNETVSEARNEQT